jgi:DNA polymerase-3 subunit epsilon
MLAATPGGGAGMRVAGARPVRPPRPHAPTADEAAAHAAFLARLKEPVWNP